MKNRKKTKKKGISKIKNMENMKNKNQWKFHKNVMEKSWNSTLFFGCEPCSSVFNVKCHPLAWLNVSQRGVKRRKALTIFVCLKGGRCMVDGRDTVRLCARDPAVLRHQHRGPVRADSAPKSQVSGRAVRQRRP